MILACSLSPSPPAASIPHSPGLLVAALLLALAPSLSAAESEEPLLQTVTSDQNVLVVDNNLLHTFVDGDFRVVLLQGNVHVRYGATDIYADTILLWYDYTDSMKILKDLDRSSYSYGYQAPDLYSSLASARYERSSREPIGPGDPLEFYAEGHVKITGDEGVFFCDRIYTHFKEKRGVLLSGEFFGEAEINGKNHPLHLKCESLKQVCDALYSMEDVSFSTCLHGIPHYDLHVERGLLEGSPGEGLLSLNGTSLRFREVPLPLPDTSFEIGRHWYFPVKHVKLGQSSRYGSFLELGLEEDFDSWGDAFHSALGIDNRFRGTAGLNILLSQKRGLGWEPDIEYESPDLYKGYLKGFYIVDRADKDRGGAVIEEHKRGRIRTQNRIAVDEYTDLDLELSYITDPKFLDEYFEQELKTDKEQETYIYLHRAEGWSAYSIMGRFRLNDFDTQNEYLPQALWDISAVPLLKGAAHTSPDRFINFLGLFYGHRFEISQVRNRPADGLSLPSERLLRGDYRDVFEAPIKVSDLKITPFYLNQVSFFERVQGNSEPRGRVLEAFGARTGLLLHNRSDFTWDFFNIHGVRNILEPTAEYRNNFAVSRSSNELIPFDDVETGDRGDALTLGLRHRFQTRNVNDADRPHDLYDGYFTLPFHPDRRLSANGHRMDNLNYDLWFMPLFQERWLNGFSLNEEGEYDLTHNRAEVVNSTLVYAPQQDYLVTFGHRWIRHSYSYLTTGARALLTNKWEAEAGIQYNIENREWANRLFILRRRAHQWLFELKIEVDTGDNNTSFSLSFMPLAFFGKNDRRSIYDPRQGR